MWILTSLSRPQRIRELVDSYAWGGESQVVLTLYAKDPLLQQYLDQPWPFTWSTEIVDVRGNANSYNEMFRRHPKEQCYGFLADDVVLKTPGMLAELERSAGEWNVAYPNDGVWLEGGLATMPCIGGSLARAAGYLAPPNFVHMSIDSVWTRIGERLNCLKYRPDLQYTHNHPLVGRAQWDSTYVTAQQMSVGHEQVLRSFLMGQGLAELARRVDTLRD